MTAAELKSLGEAIDELFAPYRGRMLGSSPRPADGLPVAFIAQGFPVGPPSTHTDDTDTDRTDKDTTDAQK
jgi:hypothetical protein